MSTDKGYDMGPFIFCDVIDIICLIVDVVFLVKTLNGARKQGSLGEGGDRYMFILSLILMACFIIHQFFSAIDYTYSAATGKQNEALGITGVFYFFGRFFMYGIFIHRLNHIIQHSFNPYNKSVIRWVYINFIIMIVSAFLTIIGYVSKTLPLLYIGGFSFILFDIIFCITLPILFINKLYQLVQYQNQSNITHHTSVASVGSTSQIEIGNKNNNDMQKELTTSIQISGHGDKDSGHSNDSDKNAEHRKTESHLKKETSIPSIQPLGATSENAPVSQDKNQFKYDTILNAIIKISLLSSITLITSAILLPIGIASQGFDNSTWAGGIPEGLIKIDEMVIVICVCLCFKFNNDWYKLLCSSGHAHCEKYQWFACCQCWLSNK